MKLSWVLHACEVGRPETRIELIVHEFEVCGFTIANGQDPCTYVKGLRSGNDVCQPNISPAIMIGYPGRLA
jgi:hypothetical protein